MEIRGTAMSSWRYSRVDICTEWNENQKLAKSASASRSLPWLRQHEKNIFKHMTARLRRYYINRRGIQMWLWLQLKV